MKHSTKSALAAAAMFLLASVSYSQQNTNQANSVIQTTAMVNKPSKQLNDITEKVSSKDILESNPGLKAIFVKMFPMALDQQWFQMEKGFFVSFTNEGKKTRAGFDLNGKFNYAVASCNKEQLPLLLRNEMDRKYSKYNLIDGIQITAFDQVSYQAMLQDGNKYVTLKTYGEEIEIIRRANGSAGR